MHTPFSSSLLFLGILLGSLNAFVAGLGSSCSAPLSGGDSTSSEPFWLQSITHQGTAPYGPGGYQVFRNVKDFGAKGDGVTDDTAAINNAISSGGRCGSGCGESSTTPALVYFPQGTYLISSPIQALYYTQLIGDAKHPPTLLSAANFAGIAIIDADPGWYDNTDNFYRAIRNFVIDLTRQPASNSATGIHWQVSQATSLHNIVFQMSTAAGNAHQGIWMENGSGGFMGDLVFNGGKFGMWVGNQQFTVRNITVNNANTGVYGNWGWGWTFQGVTFNNVQVGFDLVVGQSTWDQAQGWGSQSIIDAVVTNTPVFVRQSQPPTGTEDATIVLNNIQLNNVPTAVGVTNGQVLLAGGTTRIDSWAMGNQYHGSANSKGYTQGNIASISKAGSLLDSAGRILSKGHPQYEGYGTDQFVSVKSQGARGDGNTDDTAALQAVFNKYAGCKIIFFDAGVYVVTNTLSIPAGVQIVGEAWSTILGSGSNFEDYNNPRPVVQVGAPGSTGIAEITDIIFSTRGPAAGAIVVEWNVHDPSGQQGAAGTWDTHIILAGKAGTNLQASTCPTSGSGGNACFAAFLGLHITSGASAYLEGLWVWLADHDLDQGSQLSAWSGRGILSESQGPVWLIGTASEHNIMYQYSLVGAANHYLGLIQTESPYFQPNPSPPAPFILNSNYHDPTSYQGGSAWALSISNSKDILILGAGLWSWFSNYNQNCLTSFNCQSQIVNIDSSSTVSIYNLNTVASTWMLSVNGNGVVNANDNHNGYAETIAIWTYN